MPELDENKLYDYKVVKAATGKTMEGVANEWAKVGWRVVGVVGGSSTGSGNLFILERPKGEVCTELIRLEVDLEKIFTEASGTLACDAGELLDLIREIEKEHNPS